MAKKIIRDKKTGRIIEGAPQETNKNGLAGRPSKYKPEYCQILIDKMGQGYSYEASAGFFDCCGDTLYEWEQTHPDFSDAKKKAFIQNRIFWEKLGVENILNESFGNGQGSKSLNAAVWCFNMKNRFGWRDKQEISGDKDSPLQISITQDHANKILDFENND